MNIHDAHLQHEVESAGDGLAVLLGGQVLPLPAFKAQKVRGHKSAIKFGLRPEHVSAVARPQGDSFAVQGALRFTEHMGSEVFVHFEVGGVVMSARVPADQLNGLHEKKRGDAHTFYFQMDKCHLFDADSGLNLL